MFGKRHYLVAMMTSTPVQGEAYWCCPFLHGNFVAHAFVSVESRCVVCCCCCCCWAYLLIIVVSFGTIFCIVFFFLFRNVFIHQHAIFFIVLQTAYTPFHIVPSTFWPLWFLMPRVCVWNTLYLSAKEVSKFFCTASVRCCWEVLRHLCMWMMPNYAHLLHVCGGENFCEVWQLATWPAKRNKCALCGTCFFLRG